MSQTTKTDVVEEVIDLEIDIKPRSREVTDGLEATASRGMLRAVGMGDDDWENRKLGLLAPGMRSRPATFRLIDLPRR